MSYVVGLQRDMEFRDLRGFLHSFFSKLCVTTSCAVFRPEAISRVFFFAVEMLIRSWLLDEVNYGRNFCRHKAVSFPLS